jgi:hypothetical protein
VVLGTGGFPPPVAGLGANAGLFPVAIGGFGFGLAAPAQSLKAQRVWSCFRWRSQWLEWEQVFEQEGVARVQPLVLEERVRDNCGVPSLLPLFGSLATTLTKSIQRKLSGVVP